MHVIKLSTGKMLERKTNYKNKEEAGCRWLTPVILATQEDHGSKPAQATRS
jgi:hypothetical protein